MPKRERGEIRVHQRLDGHTTYSLRFRVNGHREALTLGTDAEGWTHRKAERKLEDVLAQVRAGVWRPPQPVQDDDAEITFHEFASRWWASREAELRPRSRENYEWRIRKHLLPFFADYQVGEIDVALVARYREHKVIEREARRAALAEESKKPKDQRRHLRRPMSNGSINQTLLALAQILDSAVERGLLPGNPARGKRRRLKHARPPRVFLERDELRDLLAAAEEMDRKVFRDHPIGRRPIIALMGQAGLRVSEVCRLRWRDVDLDRQRLIITDAKTDAGNRAVDLGDDAAARLAAWRDRCRYPDPDDPVFATSSGRARDRDNVRARILRPVVNEANEARERAGRPPLRAVTPHALRRTYVTLMFEAGAPVPYVMSQVGHEDSRTTLEIYARVQQRLSRRKVQLAFDALLNSAEAPSGRPGKTVPRRATRARPDTPRRPAKRRPSTRRRPR
jgi:integrase/recombinase XerC